MTVVAVVVSLVAVVVACRAWLTATRAAASETRRRQAARIAGEHGWPGAAFKVEPDGNVSVRDVKPGEMIPSGWQYTPASRNGAR